MRRLQILLLPITILLLWSGPASRVLPAQAVFEQIDFCADGDYFSFDVRISGLQAGAIFRINPDELFASPNAQTYATNWDTNTGAFVYGPLIEVVGTPVAHRWQVEPVAFTSLELLPGDVWRIWGAIRNGTEPLTPSDTVRELFVRYFDGVFLDTRAPNLPIGNCNNLIFVDRFESGDTTLWSQIQP